MKYFEIEAKTPEEALSRFLSEQDIAKDYVEYEVLEEGSKGFLGFGSKNAKIKVAFDDKEFMRRKAKLTLSELLDKMGFTDYRIETSEQQGTYILNITSSESSLLIGKTAQTLDSIQFLMDKMLGSAIMDTPDIMIDVENYRKRMIKQLRDEAVKLAKNVKKSGRTQKMRPMVTMIRKEIHLAVKEIDGVTTVSRGQGNVKELLIVSEKKNRQRRKPRRDS